mmetsp:Transcript_25269/g.28263  ORF Transcript_25269/g.28263 Transcript_25269/m.28263 type:complete len:336 (+) Transcript_25269:97-1104(+)
MLYPTFVLHDSLHFGLFFISFSSVKPIGFINCIPISIDTVHFPPQKSHLAAFVSSKVIPRVCNPRLRFSPANNSTVSLLSTPSPHCIGGYSTTTLIFGHRRILFTFNTSDSISEGKEDKRPIVVSKFLHSQSNISLDSDSPPDDIVTFWVSMLAMESPAIIPAFSAFPLTPETMVRPYSSSRPPASSNNSIPIPPTLLTTTRMSSTKWSFEFESKKGILASRSNRSSPLTDTVQISAAASASTLYTFSSTTLLESRFLTGIGFSKSESAGAERSNEHDDGDDGDDDALPLFTALFRILFGTNANDPVIDIIIRNSKVPSKNMIIAMEDFVCVRLI